MTATVAPSEQELQRLYERYKSLTLASTAALMLERPVDALGVQAEVLLGECRAASCAAGQAPRYDACVAAAEDLSELLRRASLGEETSPALDRVRASHRRLRREVWEVHPCEYVPCCVSGAHHH